MKEVKLKGKVEVDEYANEINIEFGRYQVSMSFSGTGSVQRKLRLKDEQKVDVIIKAK